MGNDKATQALNRHLHELDEKGRSHAQECKVTLHNLIVGDNVTDCGSTTVQYDDDLDLFRFDISLGPVNARKLVDFLYSLGEEPEREAAE